MSEWDRLRERAKIIKEQFPEGTRVMLKQMDNMQAPPFGTLGTVVEVDDIGNILVQWDNGSTLSITEEDECIKLGERG